MAEPAFYTRATLAARLGLSPDTVKRKLPEWRGALMPAPLPWSTHEDRWNRDAIERWIARTEAACGSHGRATVPLAMVTQGQRREA